MELNEGASLPPGKITFVAVLSTAKPQFRLSKPEWNAVPGSPQLIPMVLPETCAVLNRRASEREDFDERESRDRDEHNGGDPP